MKNNGELKTVHSTLGENRKNNLNCFTERTRMATWLHSEAQRRAVKDVELSSAPEKVD